MAAEDDRPTPWLTRELRANPAYRLVLFDRLEPAERAALAGPAAEPDFYGVLRPVAGLALGLKSVDRETALLFLTLREAGPLPGYVRALRGDETWRLVARLVADGVLEISAGVPGGGFVSGAAAMELLAPRAVRPPGQGRLGELSLAALRYGARLAVDDPLTLSWRLYGFNRLPLTPAWQRRLASAAAVEGFLGIDRGGPVRRLLDDSFVATGSDAGWLSWSARRPGAPRDGAGGASFKLYVSPQPEALPALMDGLLGGLAEAGAASFKIGSAASGLLRPDKVVAYFADFEALAAAAEPLARRLEGAPVQGVPFTSEIAGGGLLSWGIDPPAGGNTLPWSGVASWRLWLTHRLARALLQARAAAAAEPWRFALERLELEGIDTASWTPPAALFREI